MFIGYARVSTDEQTTDPQIDELKAAGCAEIVKEHGSGADRSRPALIRILKEIKPGDVLVVVRLDRLARSVSHLLEVIERLQKVGANFKSLRDPIDTSTAQGMFTLQILGAVAQLERALISERTRAGIRAAMARGKHPGNPGLRDRDPAARQKISDGRDLTFTSAVVQAMDDWAPVVLSMRPDHSWEEVLRVLNSRRNGEQWTKQRLMRAARRAARECLIDPKIFERSKMKPPKSRLQTLIGGIKLANPKLSLRDIAAQLESMGERTPRGGRTWSASSVKHLADRFESL